MEKLIAALGFTLLHSLWQGILLVVLTSMEFIHLVRLKTKMVIFFCTQSASLKVNSLYITPALVYLQ